MTDNMPVSGAEAPKTVDTYSYKGWMNSDSFMKRSFGVFGYHFVSSLIINVVIWILLGMVFVAVGGMALLAGLSQK